MEDDVRQIFGKSFFWTQYDEESDHSNKAVRKTPEIESGHKVAEEVKWT